MSGFWRLEEGVHGDGIEWRGGTEEIVKGGEVGVTRSAFEGDFIFDGSEIVVQFGVAFDCNVEIDEFLANFLVEGFNGGYGRRAGIEGTNRRVLLLFGRREDSFRIDGSASMRSRCFLSEYRLFEVPILAICPSSRPLFENVSMSTQQIHRQTTDEDSSNEASHRDPHCRARRNSHGCVSLSSLPLSFTCYRLRTHGSLQRSLLESDPQHLKSCCGAVRKESELSLLYDVLGRPTRLYDAARL